MPRTRRASSGSVHSNGGDGAGAQSVLNSSIVMTQDMLSNLMTSFASSNTHSGNFSQCTARYSGRPEDLDNFLDAVNTYKDCVNVSDENALRGLSMLLVDSAGVWWQGIKRSTTSWDDAMTRMRSAFGDQEPPYRIYKKLFALDQGEEHTDLFVAKVRALFAKLPTDDITEKVQLDMAYGLLNQRIRKRLSRENVASFEDLLRKCRSIEDSLKECSASGRKQQVETGSRRPQPRYVSGPGESAPEFVNVTAPRAKKPFCSYCRRFGHSKDACERVLVKSDIPTRKSSDIKCYGCGAANVIKSKCKTCNPPAESFYSVDNTRRSEAGGAPPGCSAAGGAPQRASRASPSQHKPPHESRPPPAQPRRSRTPPTERSRRSGASRETPQSEPRRSRAPPTAGRTKEQRQPNPPLRTSVQGNPTDAAGVFGTKNRDFISQKCNDRVLSTVDTSSVDACIDKCCDKNIDKNVFRNDSNFCNCGFVANISKGRNNDSRCSGRMNNDNSDGKIIDKNVFRKKSNFCKRSSVTNISKERNNDSRCFKKVNDCVSVNDDVNCIRLDNDVCFNSCENGNNVPFRRPVLNISILGHCGTALVDSAAKGCIAGHTLHALLQRLGHPLVPSTQVVRLADGVSREMNVLTTEVKVTLKNKTKGVKFLIFPDSNSNESLLGIDFLTIFNLVFDFGNSSWHFADDDKQKFEMQFERVSPVSQCAAVDVLRDDEATSLSVQQRDELARLLVDHQDIFEPGGAPTPFAEHAIDTGDHPPVAVPPYRLTPAKKEVMRAELDKMLADDIVEECESAWGAPALLVPKANGKVRFCVDYRKLNAVTKTDVYPMPLIDELVQSTKKNCFMSSIDMRSGYWQVSVREQDRDKTAFLTPFGTYRFKRMPFGLKNSPSTFQRLIDRLRSGASLKDVTLLAYQDDLLVITEGNFEKHVEDLRAVFERLRMFKLRANREKCVFARDEVKYLGHVITQDGVSPDDDKVRAVLDMKAPSSLKHLRTFIQTCSWFRKFIPNFSGIAEPLTRLTKKNQQWSWGPDQDRAFEDLKQRLSSAPVLRQADYSKPFIVRTDASNYALGAVLLQGEGKDERPIEYASRLLTQAERNYSTTEREALAVVWAIEKFRGYIEGHEIIVGSDHQPLKWLLTLKSPSGRLVRWALKLQSFNIQLQYTPGKANVIADALSRPTCKEEDRNQCGVCSVVVDLPARSPADLRRAQLDDLELKKIVSEMEDVSDADSIGLKRWSERGYFLQQGVLYRYNPDVESEEPQLVVPESLRPEILKECHDSAGHHGVDRTYSKVAHNFCFPGMRRAIAEYIKTCVTCQRYKPSNTKPSGLLQTPVLNQRGEVLAIDLFGPLPAGRNGEKWVLLVEDTATRWTELFALKEATSEACARTLIEEYFLRYGFPRRVVSDNGVQFVSAVMQQCMFVLGISQELLPLYHPAANPAERKNRDLKFHLSRLVDADHTSWPQHLPEVRFAMNSAVCQTTGVSPAYLTFARELRSPLDVQHDIRSILNKDNFVPQITPYLKKFVSSLIAVRERVDAQQDRRKQCADKARKPGEVFDVGDQVLLKSHVLSNAARNITAKFVPKRDGPYVIVGRASPTAYLIADLDAPEEVLGKFHVSELTRFHCREETESPPRPVVPRRQRGRPRKHVCPVC